MPTAGSSSEWLDRLNEVLPPLGVTDFGEYEDFYRSSAVLGDLDGRAVLVGYWNDDTHGLNGEVTETLDLSGMKAELLDGQFPADHLRFACGDGESADKYAVAVLQGPKDTFFTDEARLDLERTTTLAADLIDEVSCATQ